MGTIIAGLGKSYQCFKSMAPINHEEIQRVKIIFVTIERHRGKINKVLIS
jgi:hypothetical protein